MNETNTNWHFEGIKKHHVILYPLIKNFRTESFEKTMNLLDTEDHFSNIGYFPRTTHLYKSQTNILNDICQKVLENNAFISSEIVHSASDLGLPYKIKAVHSTKSILYFDGLHIRVTKEVSTEQFLITELSSKTRYPEYEWEVVNNFFDCVRGVYPKEDIFGLSNYRYYTFTRTNWEQLGLKREGTPSPQVRLIINDPRIVTITALVFAKKGKDYQVYFGEEDTVHQMIGHDLFIEYEINCFTEVFNNKLLLLMDYQKKMVNDFYGIMTNFWHIFKKHKLWNEVKAALRSIYIIQDIIERGLLLLRTIENLIENKVTFFNGPRQIWLAGEVQDHEEKIQHSIKNFFEIKLLDNKLDINSQNVIDPIYSDAYGLLKKKVAYISDYCKELYARERDILTAYQTEFTLYAVWIALLALLIAVLTVFKST